MTYSETKFATSGPWWCGGWFGPIIVGGAAAVVFAAANAIYPPTLPPPIASAHVKIVLPNGHGSATHIGDGLYVTAAHVVDGQTELTINGAPVQVMWANKEYDIALVRGSADAAFVPLACIIPQVGDQGVAHGNPMNFEDITTTLTVAGDVRTIGDWKSALPMDGTMAPGMSGGSWVMGGHVAGVNVGVSLAPAGAGFPSYYGISIIVPASVVCDLLGRT